jgi:hypothetical protein
MKRSPITRKTPMARASTRSTTPAAAAGLLRVAAVQRQAKKRKCAVKTCRAEFVPAQPFVKWCSPACGSAIALGKLAKQKVAKAREAARADRANTKERKAALKTRSDWVKLAQASFNRYIRLRAIRWRHTCISSGMPLPVEGLGGGFDCGHYRSVGSAPHLRFNMNNAWGQAKQDNRYGSGAAVEYRKGLIARRGIDVVEALEGDNTPRKFTVEYLQRIKIIFDKKARRIAKCIQ